MESDEVVNVFKNQTDHKAQLEGLVILLDKAFPAPGKLDANKLEGLVQAVVGLEAGSMVVSRHFVQSVLDRLETAQAQINQQAIVSIYQRLLDVLQTRAISYEDQVCVLRYRLADIYECQGNHAEAAQILSGLPVETGQKPMQPTQKMDLYLRIARLLLEDRQYGEADLYVNRAGHHQTEASSDLSTKFKATSARVLDCKRKFIDAAQRYYEVSLLPDVTKEEKDDALIRSMTCTILASPGTARSQMLSTLYKDERTHPLHTFALLQKLFLDRLVKPNELTEFEKTLDVHQRAGENGQSIVRDVILEHNMTAASLLYTSISFETLGTLLGIDREKAEEIVVQIISTSRLSGAIDQIEGIVTFKGMSALRQMDEQILTMCQQVNIVSNMILAAHPELIAQ